VPLKKRPIKKVSIRENAVKTPEDSGNKKYRTCELKQSPDNLLKFLRE
jgi:hypothetical protein